MSSNPKHPQLTGYKMRQLWSGVRNAAEKLFSLHNDMGDQEDRFFAFQERWGANPPRTEKQWLEFWQELVGIRRSYNDARNRILQCHRDALEISEQGLDIVEANGIGAVAPELVKELEAALTTARAMQE
jgi:hypothetical protein